MTETVLFYIHYVLLLLFGILLSFSFADVRFNKKTIAVSAVVFTVSGLMQLFAYTLQSEEMVWKLYPLITHLPVGIALFHVYHKSILTATAALSSAYLCCQLPKWVGMLAKSCTDSQAAEYAARILVLLITGYVAIRYFSRYVSHIFSQEQRKVLIFGAVPIIYYIFDYSMSIYTDFWQDNNRVAAEFMPFFLCIIYFLFFMIYYKEYEEKAAAIRKEHLITIAIEQQKKEMTAIRRNEHEIRIMRHDMKHFLHILSLHLQEGDIDSSIKMVDSLTSRIQNTTLQKFCANDLVNHILSDFSDKCDVYRIKFETDIRLESLQTDEIIFCSILSNALDNAVNAVRTLPAERRRINLMLKESDSRLLLSVKNQFCEKPIIVDGMPVSKHAGQNHGYGTQSIRYLTEKAGGNCQFSIADEYFILRVII